MGGLSSSSMSTLGLTNREEEKGDRGRCEGATALKNGGGASGPALVIRDLGVLSHIRRNLFQKIHIYRIFSPFAAGTLVGLPCWSVAGEGRKPGFS